MSGVEGDRDRHRNHYPGQGSDPYGEGRPFRARSPVSDLVCRWERLLQLELYNGSFAHRRLSSVSVLPTTLVLFGFSGIPSSFPSLAPNKYRLRCSHLNGKTVSGLLLVLHTLPRCSFRLECEGLDLRINGLRSDDSSYCNSLTNIYTGRFGHSSRKPICLLED